MNTLAINYQTKIASIEELMVKGIEAWQQAGRIIADLVDQDPEAIEKICEVSPHLSAGILRSLERIGRSELLPELLLKSGPAYAKLRELPISYQRKYMSEPIPLLINTDSGPDTLSVSIENLTPKQAKQVFSRTGVRDLAAQRACPLRYRGKWRCLSARAR
jgi:hypothetical protein